MSPPPDREPTTGITVMRLLDDPQNNQAWERFVKHYSPLILRWAQARIAHDEDACNVAQEVLYKLLLHLKSYDRKKGRFRPWLRQVVRNACMDFLRSSTRQPGGTGDSRVHELLANVAANQPDALEELIRAMDAQLELELYQLAIERVQQRVEACTWQAFCQVALEGQDPQQVAAALDKPITAVYMARHRVSRMLREEMEKLEQDGPGH
jgi:RNA polymerase sigma-70 factor (ECF subfamily)